MLVKDIIKLSCDFLDKSELAEKISSSSYSLSEEESKEIASLEKCFNLVREEIALELLPSVKVDKVKSQNLKVPFTLLSSQPINIFAVKDLTGRTVKHRIMQDYIVVFANEVEIWYTSKPEKLAIKDKFSSILPERIYAYGVAREYYIKKSLYNDAKIWEERFKNSVEMLEPKKSGRSLPRRRWL